MTGWFGVSSSNFSNLAWLSATCTLSSLLPLPLLGLLPLLPLESRARGGSSQLVTGGLSAGAQPPLPVPSGAGAARTVGLAPAASH